jgi:acyl-CoA thioester hydrolase
MGVYFDDLDAFRILHNAKYLLLFERTLGSFWEELGAGGFADEGRREHWHLVRANAVEYLRPVRGTGRVRVRVWIDKLGNTSLTFGFRIMPMWEDVDHARGTRVVVCVEPESGQPQPWPSSFRQRLADWAPVAS